MGQSKYAKTLKKVWNFIWNDDSIWSWVVNIVLAFVLIKFLVYPALGFVLSTSHPIVAVVSFSMEHQEPFDEWWEQHEAFYTKYGISKEEFQDYRFSNGFNTGDIMILRGKELSEIEKGDVLVFMASLPDPIIHRTVRVWEENGKYYFQTKGDFNPGSGDDIMEKKIVEDRVLGVAVFRIPYLGYIKIWAFELAKPFIGVYQNVLS